MSRPAGGSTSRPTSAALLALVYGVVAAGLALVYFRPVAAHFSTKILGDHPDRYFSLWGIDWVLRQGFGLAGPLFDANVLYPHKHTLLFSDTFIGEALVASPLALLGASQATIYNTVLIVGVVASAAAAGLLGAELTGSRAAGLVALVCFGFYPSRAVAVSHLNLQYTFGLPLCLWGLWLFSRRGWSWAIYLTGLALAVQAYFSSQMVIWTTIGLVLAAPLFALGSRGWRRRRQLIHALVAMVASLCAVAPLAAGYLALSRDMGFARTMREAVHYSGTIKGLWNDRGLLLFDPWPWDRSSDEVGYLGIAVLALAAVGLLTLAVRALLGDRRLVLPVGALGLALLATGAILFVGPVLKEHGERQLPFWWLRDVVPGLSGVRVPARGIVLSHLGLALLATVGAAGLAQLLRWRWLGALAAAGCAAGAFVMWLPRPSPLQQLRRPSAAVAAISELPEQAVVLPWPGFRAWNLQSYQNYDAVFHGHTIVGGYSGIHSWLYNTLYHELDAMPAPRALAIAEAIGATHFVLEPQRLDANRRQALAEALAAGSLRGPVVQAGGFEAYTLPRASPRRAGPEELRALAPLAYAGPNRAATGAQVTSALELPVDFVRPLRVEWRTGFRGEVALRCGEQTLRRPVMYKVPGVLDEQRRLISAVWAAPAVTGRCQAHFIAWDRELAAAAITLEPFPTQGAGAAEVELVSFPSPAWPETSAELVVAIRNRGQRPLLANSDVLWPFAEGELKLDCRFGGSADGHLRTEAEFNRGALPRDLMPGERIVVHLRAPSPRRAGTYPLTCRALEFARGEVGPASQPLQIEVRSQP